MLNKYLYSFLKDKPLQLVCILSIVGVISCLILLRLDVYQSLELNSIQDKQRLIAQLPELEAKIAQMKGSVNGLVLNGIISQKSEPMAVINNTLIKVGEEIDGKKVITITDHSATVCSVKGTYQCVMLLLQQ